MEFFCLCIADNLYNNYLIYDLTQFRSQHIGILCLERLWKTVLFTILLQLLISNYN